MVRLRRAEMRDWAALLYWRNDAETRAQFKQQEVVSLKDHLRWLTETLAREETALYIADDDEAVLTVGTIRLDAVKHGEEDWAECSITVDPQVRGRHYATAIIACVVDQGGTWKEQGLIAGLLATVKADNYASLRAFAACDFQPVKMTEKFVTLERAFA